MVVRVIRGGYVEVTSKRNLAGAALFCCECGNAPPRLERADGRQKAAALAGCFVESLPPLVPLFCDKQYFPGFSCQYRLSAQAVRQLSAARTRFAFVQKPLSLRAACNHCTVTVRSTVIVSPMRLLAERAERSIPRTSTRTEPGCRKFIVAVCVISCKTRSKQSPCSS